MLVKSEVSIRCVKLVVWRHTTDCFLIHPNDLVSSVVLVKSEVSICRARLVVWSCTVDCFLDQNSFSVGVVGTGSVAGM